ncbi:MAG: hypothetical protein IBX48_10310 [Thiomicrospira sp.]|uniref:hypothetical protein n=1 Tax=Thiomicrospira sp. TaxID=935 RepID=UPI0019F66758|nr:hypothetical protein [Thiomicrospira sp.]MBE0494713.1 hypothetical protein [Thiomicrospira sp.]
MIIDTQKITDLPLASKLELLEVISNALYKESDQFESPSWHEDVLKARAHELNEPHTWLTLDEVKRELSES